MSHFACLVVMPDDVDILDKDIEDRVSKQLAPFHEFECTGITDYVKELDVTEETRDDWKTYTTTRYAFGGELRDPSDFYREPTWGEREAIERVPAIMASSITDGLEADAIGYRVESDGTIKVQFQPEGVETVEVPYSDVMGFREFCGCWLGLHSIGLYETPDLDGRHKYGWLNVDDDGEVISVIKRTNPNAKWDWWVIGGRWTGFFQLKPGSFGASGRPGVFMAPNRDIFKADVARKGDIDFETMRREKAAQAAERYDAAQAIIAGRSFASWESIRAEYEDDIRKAREVYGAQDVVEDFQQAAFTEYKRLFGFNDKPEDFTMTREKYLETSRNSAATPFAVLMDGEWHERGKMGWWGTVSDETDQNEWNRRVQELYDSVSDDTVLVLVDCHI